MMQVKTWYGRAKRFAAHMACFSRGYAAYLRTGETPWESFMSMRQLYCTTNGRLNDAVASAYQLFRPRPPLQETTGALGTMTPQDVHKVVKALRRDGCYIFPQKLAPAVCDSILNYASRVPLTAMFDDGRPHQNAVYDPARPIAVRYNADLQTIMECDSAQQLVADAGVRAIAQAYLRTDAVQDLVAMWWSTSVKKEAS